MTTTTTTTAPTRPIEAAPRRRSSNAAAVVSLAGRRLALSARTPRELLIPVMTPLLFALVIAPALGDTVGNAPGGVDYMTFVAVSTIGLLVPISCMTAGLGVVVDRLGGARRNLLAAPVPRPLIVVGNLVVAIGLSALQIAVVLGASALRGAALDIGASGLAWFGAAAVGFTLGMYSVAEVLANRVPSQEEYIGMLPAIAIVPWFLAGSLFPISALPAGLTVIAKVLPITHVMALVRYGLIDPQGQSLHDIWGMSNTTAMATLSLAVVALFAVALTAIAIRVFSRTAVD